MVFLLRSTGDECARRGLRDRTADLDSLCLVEMEQNSKTLHGMMGDESSFSRPASGGPCHAPELAIQKHEHGKVVN